MNVYFHWQIPVLKDGYDAQVTVELNDEEHKTLAKLWRKQTQEQSTDDIDEAVTQTPRTVGSMKLPVRFMTACT